MFNENYINAKEKMKAKGLKSALVFIFDYFFMSLFLLTVISVIYLFIADTEYLDSVGVFTNDFTLGIACFIAVMDIILLFFLTFYFKMKKEAYFMDINYSFSFNMLTEFIAVSLLCFLRKLFSFIFFMLPAASSFLLLYVYSKSGISRNIFIISLVAAFILTMTGLVCYLIYIQRYTFVNYIFIIYPFIGIRNIFREALSRSDGMLLSMFKFRVSAALRKASIILLFPALYYYPLCKFAEYDYIFKYKKPYPRKNVNTEKSVVFYFDTVKES